ncbi:MAG: potassium channel family protein [Candidatus Hodarchaeota archaeon]
MAGQVKSLGRIISVFLGLLLSIWKLLAVIGVIFSLSVVCLMWADGKCFGQSVYLAFITFLPIGYGDFTPVSTIARVACVILGFVGLAFMGIVVAATIKAIEKS